MSAVALLKNKKNEKLVTPKARQNHVFGEQKPLKRSPQILHAAWYAGHNYACQFWWRSVRDSGVARGRILAIFIDLLRRHYNTLALSVNGSSFFGGGGRRRIWLIFKSSVAALVDRINRDNSLSTMPICLYCGHVTDRSRSIGSAWSRCCRLSGRNHGNRQRPTACADLS